MSHAPILLLHPPYGDYTYPYHSLSYLVPPLKKAGYEVEVLDLNAVWFRHLFRRSVIDEWQVEIKERLAHFESLQAWSIEDQIEVVRLIRSLAVSFDLDPEEAVRILRSDLFYNYDYYLKAQNCVRNFERLLEYAYPTYPFYTAFAAPPGEPNAAELIDGIRLSRRYIEDVAHILKSKYGDAEFLFCGISVPFSGNLRLGFATLTAVEQVFPGTVKIAGGTAITDLYKNRLSDEVLAPLGEFCDFLLPGEGDESVVDFANWRAGRSEHAPGFLFDLKNPGNNQQPEKYTYINLGAGNRLPPDYDWVDWSLYLSPERQINYSPTRGCFWNKCTFCDYGLNEDLPTAPYRSSPVETSVEDLLSLSEKGIKHVYLAVDAIAPVFLRQFASQLLSKGGDIHWSGEFFLTKDFTPEMVELLERSGLITASFGLESGSNKVLEAMGKGKDRVDKVYVPAFNAFAGSKIGLQPKFFFGFPGETDEDRWATLRLLNDHRASLSVITNGNIFDLTSGSIVAKTPASFGIESVARRRGSDIDGACDYTLSGGQRVPVPADFIKFNDHLGYFHAFERPWVGGIDTFHSKLYMQHYGKDIFHRLGRIYSNRSEQTFPWASISIRSGFDIDEVFDNVLVYAAVQHSCTLERMSAAMDISEIEEGLAQLQTPIERSPSEADYSVRFH